MAASSAPAFKIHQASTDAIVCQWRFVAAEAGNLSRYKPGHPTDRRQTPRLAPTSGLVHSVTLAMTELTGHNAHNFPGILRVVVLPDDNDNGNNKEGRTGIFQRPPKSGR